MSVTLYLDPYNMKKDRDIVHVSSEDEYRDAWKKIEANLESNTNIKVAVHNKVMLKWFDSFCNIKTVAVKSLEPCFELAYSLDTKVQELPQLLREEPEIIVQMGLIEKANELPRKKDQDASSWVCEHTLGQIWTLPYLSDLNHLNQLLQECLLDNDWINSIPTLLALRGQCVESWRCKGPYAPVVHWLFDGDSKERSTALVLYAAIHNYPPKIQADALNPDGYLSVLVTLAEKDSLAPNIPPMLSEYVSCSYAFSKVVKNYLESLARQEDRFNKILAVAGGFLKEECDILERLLQEQPPEKADEYNTVVSRIRVRFSQTKPGMRLITFSEKVKPVDQPEQFDPSCDWEVMSRWLRDQYFPYYEWCRMSGCIENTKSYVQSFEEWLVNNYDRLTRGNAYQPALIHGEIKRLLRKGPVLLVVFDGLSWMNSVSWQKAMENNKIKAQRSMAITTLPTITPLAKPSLARGQLPGQFDRKEPSTHYYAQQLSEGLGVSMSEIAYAIHTEMNMQELVQKDKRIYLYLYNEIDEQLHKSYASEKRQTTIIKRLNEVAEDLSAARTEYFNRYHQDLAIVTASDHGYTELPAHDGIRIEIEGIDPTAVVKGNRLLWIKGRPVLDAPAQCWTIDQSFLFGADDIFYVAKGYRYLGSKPHGATHGGLTPQEVIVPTLVFDPALEVRFSPLKISLTGEVRRGRKTNEITVRLVNENTWAVELLEVECRLTEIEFLPGMVLNPGDEATIIGHVDASMLRDTVFYFTGNIRTRMCEEEHKNVFDLRLTTTGAAVVDAGFEEDFDV
jgi:hypothetical protein